MVSFEDLRDAKKAFEEYNGGELDGNVLVIQFIKNQTKNSKGRKVFQPRKLKVIEKGGKRIIQKV